MVGKPIKGKSFGGCVRYVVNKKEAEILQAEGVSIQDAASIARDFNLQRKLNPTLGKAVGHTVLSWSEQDIPRLNDKIMMEIAAKYMQAMGIKDTQYVVVKHTDRAHPHVHIIFNRVNNQGKTISDQNNFLRNTKVCRSLTESYGLHIALGKEAVNRQRLQASDKVRYEIYDALRATLKTAKGWQELQGMLGQQGITLHFKCKGQTTEVQGISFEKQGLVFKGSAIDRSMSFASIGKQLEKNWQEQEKSLEQWQEQGQSLSERSVSPDFSPAGKTLSEIVSSAGEAIAGFLDLAIQQPPMQPEDPNWKKPFLRKKKKKSKYQYGYR